MKKYYKNPLKKVMKKLPPNYPVASVMVNGGLAPTATFSNLHQGVAYFINGDCAVSIFDHNAVNGINFGAAEAEEEEEA
jgi:hypothetical protein